MLVLKASPDKVHLGYYRNQLVHLFKDECVVALALASFGTEFICGSLSLPVRLNGTHLFAPSSGLMTAIGDARSSKVGVKKNELMPRIAFLCSLLQFEFIPTGNEVSSSISFCC